MDLRKLFVGLKNVVLNPMKSVKLWRATRMWKEAIVEADEKRKLDGHRYFVIWDAMQHKLISITYDIYKGRGDSYQYLRARGAFKSPLKRDELKELCFYYTTSKWRTKPIPQEVLEEKLVEWQKFYLKQRVSN